MQGRGKREIPEETPPTSGIVRHDHRTCGNRVTTTAGNRTRFTLVVGGSATRFYTAALNEDKRTIVEERGRLIVETLPARLDRERGYRRHQMTAMTRSNKSKKTCSCHGKEGVAQADPRSPTEVLSVGASLEMSMASTSAYKPNIHLRCSLTPQRSGTERRPNVRAGETGDLRENPSTSGIVRHDSHMQKSGSDPRPGIERCSPRCGRRVV
ncbi:hypothetical protein PR048_001172 [Dryococelus australis]|uniref:Uncharacterized protein n=1 Tax=Dryococelus australis TaxID=614101 RepID=A0ABQ9IGM2_9NEOP|nr:hypothetical protein PR048_001172 [Dryococelus australis]